MVKYCINITSDSVCFNSSFAVPVPLFVRKDNKCKRKKLKQSQLQDARASYIQCAREFSVCSVQTTTCLHGEGDRMFGEWNQRGSRITHRNW